MTMQIVSACEMPRDYKFGVDRRIASFALKVRQRTPGRRFALALHDAQAVRAAAGGRTWM